VIADEAQHTRCERVRVLQRKLYRAAKEAPQRKFGVLYDKVYRRDVLEEAWRRVRRNRGSAGVDKQTIEAVEGYGVARLLNELEAELREKRYRPQPVRRVYIPKPGKPGQQRGLGIPVVRDRVVQAAVKLVIEPVLEADFRDCSYGFRPKRSAHDAIEEIRTWVTWGYRQVIDADLKACFDSLSHDRVIAAVRRRITDPWILRLIQRWLKAGIFDEGAIRSAVAGTPQGGVISPLLANAYLHALDVAWEEKGHGAKLIRYCDDYVILCRGNPAAVVSADGEDRARSGVEPERGEDADRRCQGWVRLPRDALPAAADEGQSEATVLLSVASHEGDAERAPEGS
jgi:RNA-directed DNA polymerase